MTSFLERTALQERRAAARLAEEAAVAARVAASKESVNVWERRIVAAKMRGEICAGDDLYRQLVTTSSSLFSWPPEVAKAYDQALARELRTRMGLPNLQVKVVELLQPDPDACGGTYRKRYVEWGWKTKIPTWLRWW